MVRDLSDLPYIEMIACELSLIKREFKPGSFYRYLKWAVFCPPEKAHLVLCFFSLLGYILREVSWLGRMSFTVFLM